MTKTPKIYISTVLRIEAKIKVQPRLVSGETYFLGDGSLTLETDVLTPRPSTGEKNSLNPWAYVERGSSDNPFEL